MQYGISEWVNNNEQESVLSEMWIRWHGKIATGGLDMKNKDSENWQTNLENKMAEFRLTPTVNHNSLLFLQIILCSLQFLCTIMVTWFNCPIQWLKYKWNAGGPPLTEMLTIPNVPENKYLCRQGTSQQVM